MYSKINTQSGAAWASNDMNNFAIGGNQTDGLTVDTAKLAFPATAALPARLYDWLIGLRLLRNIPLDYLVPDSALLPTEAIRFFHVDETWVDRVIDGVFSAANTGTVDITYSVGMLETIRATLDKGLSDLAQSLVAGSTWTPDNGMTGMLIRSDLVRRWPDMLVRAFAGEDEKSAEMPVLRAEPISKDVYIALLAGTPSLVQLREPHVGVRFGVELDNADQTLQTYQVELRNDDGSVVIPAGSANASQITFKLLPGRVVPVKESIAAKVGNDSRMVAIQLMRPSFVQQFGNAILEQGSTPGQTILSTQQEKDGYEPVLPQHLSVGNGRYANLSGLATRAAELARVRKS